MTTSTLRAPTGRRQSFSRRCPTCGGLQCLDRPRYFAGQLLSESELNSEQAYFLAKNRLHNRYLHGWGVVCGLEVVCHECEGWVTVRPGYAIDPCGNDVIVCREHELNVVELIEECWRARRKRRQAECVPVQPLREQADCREAQYWCLTLEYVEEEGRPTTALHRDVSADAGWDRSGSECPSLCNPSASESRTAATEVRRGVGTTVGPCEPTRIFESYRLDVFQADELWLRPSVEGWWQRLFATCPLEPSAERALEERFTACYEPLKKFVLENAPLEAVWTLADLYSAEAEDLADLDPAELHQACLAVHEFLRQLYRRNPGHVHCDLLGRLEELEICVAVDPNEPVERYLERLEARLQLLTGLFVQYLLDCFCVAALPPCPPEPECDRLVLACLRVQDGRIREICNTSCRRYAGAFPPSLRGVWLGPLVPLVLPLLRALCCSDSLLEELDQLQPTETFKAVVHNLVEDDAARVKLAGKAVRDLPRELVKRVAQPLSSRGLNLAKMVDRPAEEAVAEGEEAGVTFTAVEVEKAPARQLITTLAPAARGSEYVLYKNKAGKVLGFAPQSALFEVQAAELRELREEVKKLRTRELRTIKKQVKDLRSKVEPETEK
jgi:hypothetical protein